LTTPAPPLPATWVVATTPGCHQLLCEQTETGKARPIHQAKQTLNAHGPITWLDCPTSAAPSELLDICRVAHELWITAAEWQACPDIQMAAMWRKESAPPQMGEQRSLLHAPEVGTLRVWSTDGNDMTDHAAAHHPKGAHSHADVGHSLASVAACLKSQAASDWEGMANALLREADRLQHQVRLALGTVFVVTGMGVVGLQALAMSGWNIPMADLFAVYFMLVGSAYLWARNHHWNQHQLALRALAMALHVKHIWAQAHLPHPPFTTLFPLRHKAELGWVHEALRPLNALPALPSATPNSARQTLGTWLPAETELQTQQAASNLGKANWLSRGVKACYAVSGLLTVLTVLQWPPGIGADMAVGVALGLLSSLGTLLLIFNGVLGYGPAADMHQHLVNVLQKGTQALGMNLSDHEYDELLLDLGKECIHTAAERARL
jgi:hypothetical protein